MLSIVCVTLNEPHAARFILKMHSLATRLGAELVLGLDGVKAHVAEFRGLAHKTVNVQSAGYVESVLDEVLAACTRPFVLRLDDDEAVSPALADWLERREYPEVAAFPRPYLWGDEQTFITDLYPDLQTRLTRWEKAGGRRYIHQGSPYGTGTIIPYAIEHYKFLVRSLEDRKRIAAQYEAVSHGAGFSPTYGRFNLPEDHLSPIRTSHYTDGDFSARRARAS